MNLVDYLFYRIYNYYNRKKDSTPVFMSCAVISILFVFNCYDVIVLASMFKKQTIIIPKYLVWLFIAIPIFFCTLRYRDINVIENIKQSYLNEKIGAHKRRGIIIVVYMIITFSVPLLYGFLKHNLNMNI